jgi:hypothetical protein
MELIQGRMAEGSTGLWLCALRSRTGYDKSLCKAGKMGGASLQSVMAQEYVNYITYFAV